MKKIIVLIGILFPVWLFAQNVKGIVTAKTDDKAGPLFGAGVVWINTTKSTLTDENGNFEISSEGISDKRLVISYIGYSPDTINVDKERKIKVQLYSSLTLKTAEVTYERSGTLITMNTIKTEKITTKELKKAACCNLGESFETNATVDVTYKDAITGSKELQVLGLSGSYIQLLTENAPLINGLGLTYGLNGIPGTQIDAINIVKGPGSVIYGPESMSGMINVDLKDPEKTEKIFVNGFVDENFRKELNIDKGIKVNNRLHTLFSFHIDHANRKVDENKDTFLDMPLLTNVSFLNKWKYTNGRGWMSQNSVKYLFEERMSGQTQFDFNRNNADLSAWGQKLHTNRIELYGRTGYVIPSARYKSAGVQYAFVNHQQNGFYGLRKYEGEQSMYNLRLIYNTEIGNSNSMNIGFSYKGEDVKEQFDTLNLNRNEQMPGIFVENTFKYQSRLTLIAGIRADYLNDKVYVTPRANLKYSLRDNTDLRLSAGYGFKSVNILSENPAILVSSKKIIISEVLEPEQSLNYGTNLTHEFQLGYRRGSIGFDIYRTEFLNKIRPDFDRDPLTVYFYNTKNNAYSNNFQIEGTYKILKTVEVKLAYKYLDVYTNINNVKVQDPYVAKHRVLGNIYYESFNQKWKFNWTTNWIGEKRLPQLHHSFMEEENKLKSPSYFVFNAQLTRAFKQFEVYLGAENLFDFKQNDHLIGSDNPYGPYFDASYLWGPMDGRKVYAGFRFKISNK